eukprot:3680153-Pleurochrysis_carterae.AAC.1
MLFFAKVGACARGLSRRAALSPLSPSAASVGVVGSLSFLASAPDCCLAFAACPGAAAAAAPAVDPVAAVVV